MMQETCARKFFVQVGMTHMHVSNASQLVQVACISCLGLSFIAGLLAAVMYRALCDTLLMVTFFHEQSL